MGLSERRAGSVPGAQGQTLVIQIHINCEQLSMIAGVRFTNRYSGLHEGAIKSEQIVAFLKALSKHTGKPLLIIWDGLKAHRSRLLRDYVDGVGGQIALAHLPPCAPELNPVGRLWAWLKRHALADYCPDFIAELTAAAHGKLKSTQRRTTLVAALKTG